MASSHRDSPAPYWFTRPTPPQELDLVIVGAGVIGVSTAYWAAQGGLRPVILEASGVAAGATGRSAGLLLTGGHEPFTELARRVGKRRAEVFWELCRENGELLREQILRQGRAACDFQPEGSWRVARAGSAAESEWQQSAEILAREGFEVIWRSAVEVRERSGSEALGGALFAASDAGVDPVGLCQELARRSGVEIRTGIRVRNLEPRGDRALLAWPGGSCLARRVMLAVDAAIGPLVPSLATKVEAVSLQGLATVPGTRVLEGAWLVSHGGLWLRQLRDGTLLAAGSPSPSSAAERGFLDIPTASGQARLEKAMLELFPRTVGSSLRYRWAGTMARTEDGLPWIRTLPELQQVAYASGLGGSGLSLGFALGRQLARWLGGEEEVLRPFQAVAGEVETRDGAAGMPRQGGAGPC